MREKLPNRVREFREKLNMTQEELARIVGMDKTSISKIENGKNIEIRTAQRIAEGLRTTTDILWPTMEKR